MFPKKAAEVFGIQHRAYSAAAIGQPRSFWPSALLTFLLLLSQVSFAFVGSPAGFDFAKKSEQKSSTQQSSGYVLPTSYYGSQNPGSQAQVVVSKPKPVETNPVEEPTNSNIVSGQVGFLPPSPDSQFRSSSSLLSTPSFSTNGYKLDHSVVVVGLMSGGVYAYDKVSRNSLWSDSSTHPDQIQGIAFENGADIVYIASGQTTSASGKISKHWASNGSMINYMTLPGHYIYSLTYLNGFLYAGDHAGNVMKIDKSLNVMPSCSSTVDQPTSTCVLAFPLTSDGEDWNNVYDVVASGSNVWAAGGDGKVKQYDLSLNPLGTRITRYGSKFYKGVYTGSDYYVTKSSEWNGQQLTWSGKLVKQSSGAEWNVHPGKRIFDLATDGTSIFTASEDGTAKKVDQSGNVLATLTGATDYVRTVEVDDLKIWTGSLDKVVRIYSRTGGTSPESSITLPDKVTALAAEYTTVVVNEAPVAVATSDKVDINQGQSVTFYGTQSTDVEDCPTGGDCRPKLTYRWYFKDGSAYDYSPTTAHIFNTPRDYEVELQVTDSGVAGGQQVKSSTATVMIKVRDTVGPSVQITSPANGIFTNESTVYMTYTSSASDLARYEVRLDSGSWQDVGLQTTYPFINIPEGQRTLSVRAVDWTGNTGAVASVTITVDRTLPDLTITFPANGANLNTASVTMQWTRSDTNFDKTLVRSDSGSWIDSGASTQWPFTFLDGPHTLDAIAFDKAGNSRPASVGFTVDTVAPTIVITQPRQNDIFNASIVTIVWQSSGFEPPPGGCPTCPNVISRPVVTQPIVSRPIVSQPIVSQPARNGFVSLSKGIIAFGGPAPLPVKDVQFYVSNNSAQWYDAGMDTTSYPMRLLDGTYTLYVGGVDKAGNWASPNASVSGITVDTLAPAVIHNVSVSRDTATFRIGANELVQYQVDIAGVGTLKDTANLTYRQASQSGLAISTTYQYTLTVWDRAHNMFTASGQFATGDWVAPRIYNLTVYPSNDSATVTWNTDEPTTSRVDFGTSASYGSQWSDGTLQLWHVAPLAPLVQLTLYHFNITAWDAAGNLNYTGDMTFTTTANPNHAPVLNATLPNVTTAEDTPVQDAFDLDLEVYDEDGDTVTFSLSPVNLSLADVSIDAQNFIDVNPALDASGMQMLTVTADDGRGGTSQGSFWVIVTPVNDAPVLDFIPNMTAIVDQPFYYDVNATDLENDPLMFSDNTALFDIDPPTGIISFTPNASQMGDYDVTVTVSDGALTDSQLFRISVVDGTGPSIMNVSWYTTYTSATVTWNTDEPATSRIDYGVSHSGQSAWTDPTLKQWHVAALAGLVPNTTYHFTLSGADAAGNTGQSADMHFYTAPPAGIAPVAILLPDVQNVQVNALASLDGTQSYDDQAITSHSFCFGDAPICSGTSGAPGVVTHAYSAPNVYVPVLNVYDNEGFSDSDDALVGVFDLSNPQADLTTVSQAITLNVTTPRVGDSVEISAVIFNLGGAAANNVLVQFYDNGNLLSGTSTVDVAAGNSAVATKAWTPATVGVHTINVVIDPFNAVPESNESNNVAQRDFTVAYQVGTQPPFAVLTPKYQFVNLTQPAQFYGGQSGDDVGIASHYWCFGDSMVCPVIVGPPVSVVSHTYSATGIYNVSLTVTDTDGNSASDYGIVVVADNASAVPDMAVFNATSTLSNSTPNQGEAVQLDFHLYNLGADAGLVQVLIRVNGTVVQTVSTQAPAASDQLISRFITATALGQQWVEIEAVAASGETNLTNNLAMLPMTVNPNLGGGFDLVITSPANNTNTNASSMQFTWVGTGNIDHYEIGWAEPPTPITNWQNVYLNTSYTLSPLNSHVDFRVRAFHVNGSMIERMVALWVDQAPPNIVNVKATVTNTTALVTWDTIHAGATTPEPTTGMVEYGPTTAYGTVVMDPSLVSTHSVQLSGLQPGTLYHYRVTAWDQAGNMNVSADYNFTTVLFCLSLTNTTVDSTYFAQFSGPDLTGLPSNVTDCSTATDSLVSVSNVNATTLVTSNISASDLLRTTAINSTVRDSIIKDAYLVNAYVNPSILDNATVSGDSRVLNSNVTSSQVVNFSTVNVSALQNSTISNSTIQNSTVLNSTVERSLVRDMLVEDAHIADGILLSGCVTYPQTGGVKICKPGTRLDDLYNPKGIAPVADAGFDILTTVGYLQLFNGTNSTDDVGIVSFTWDFGDGSNVTIPTNGSVIYVWHPYAATGFYTAVLNVTDNEKLSDTDDTFVVVYDNSPNPDFAITPALITFSNNAPLPGQTVTITGRVWNLGASQLTPFNVSVTVDGAPLATVTVASLSTGTYADVVASWNATPGTHSIAYSADPENAVVEMNETNNNASRSITSNMPPVAVISAAPTTQTVGNNVDFDGSGSYDTDGSIVSYAWDFGDGFTATGAVVKHSFAAPASYNVTLNVTDNVGLSSTAVVVINVVPGSSGGGSPGGSTFSSGDFILPREGVGNKSEPPKSVFVERLVTYEIGDFLVTRDYFYDPNPDSGYYTLKIVHRNNSATRVTDVVDPMLAGVTTVPFPTSVADGKATFRFTFVPNGEFEATYRFNGLVTSDQVAALGPPAIFVQQPPAPPANGTTGVEQPAPSPLTGLISFATPGFWNSLLLSLIILALVVFAAVAYLYFEEEGSPIKVSKTIVEEQTEIKVSPYEEGTLY
jgi:PKD repeat protein